MRNTTIKIALCVLYSTSAFAQLHLSGSLYTQNFDSIAYGLPAGWELDTGAHATAKGSSALFWSSPATNTRWSNASAAFKNVASANSFATFNSASNTAQLSASDRALGIRQSSTFGDAGAAFSLHLAHTFHLYDFELAFKLQSLDSNTGSRRSVWELQYALGDTPLVFTTLAIDSTGGNSYKNLSKLITFGRALDDQRSGVWIRIVSLKTSTGAGSRTTTAIDDVSLTWKGIAAATLRPFVKTVYPLNGARNVPLGSICSIRFSNHINIGSSGNIYIKNETDNTLQTISVPSSLISVSGQELHIAGLKLEPARSYHITFDSSIVDTASLTTYALTDTTEWRFSIVHSIPTTMFEYFDSSCATVNALANGWSTYNKSGEAHWHCFEHSPSNFSFRMYGHNGISNMDNVDWLIAPRLDLSAPDFDAVSFQMFKRHFGTELDVLISDDYAGSGSPNIATWSPISLSTLSSDTGSWKRYGLYLYGHTAKPLYLAFKYSSSTTAAYDIRIDSVMTLVKTGIKQNYRSAASALHIVAYPGNELLELNCVISAQGTYLIQLYNSIGQLIYTERIRLEEGLQHITIKHPYQPSGLYILNLLLGQERYSQSYEIR